MHLAPTGSDEGGVLGVGSIPLAVFPSCQYMTVNAVQLHYHENVWVVKVRNTSEAIIRPQYVFPKCIGNLKQCQYCEDSIKYLPQSHQNKVKKKTK